jgi:hypothetical protein
MTAKRVWRAAVRAWNGIPLREPWRLLVPLLVIHWLALVAFITRVNHNGWLFYQGGDQIWYWTTSWLLGHGSFMEPVVSPGWPFILVPLSWIGGGGFLGGLPGAMLIQIIVLAPIALWCMYELGARVGGRVVGYVAAVVWTLGPYIAIPLFVHRYHDRYVDQFLPIPLGLTAMADYVGIVALLASALFAVRVVENRDAHTAVLAGLTAGFAGLIKPSNLIYIGAPIVLLLAARRWRELAAGAAAMAPALFALALWKYRGYGVIPAFAYDEARVALGPDTLQAPFERYIEIDWQHLRKNLDDLREFFWSVRVVQWLPIAGAIAVARRSPPLALMLCLWFWPFVILKGSVLASTVDSGSFFRFILPAIPAFVLLAASVPLLIPKYGIAFARRAALPPARPIGRRWAIAAVVTLGLVPVGAVAAINPTDDPNRVLQEGGIATPVGAIELRATSHGNLIALDWDAPRASGANIFYRLYGSPSASDHSCFEPTRGVGRCEVASPELRTTRRNFAVDSPGPGTWTYRVGAAANWVDDPEMGDVFLLSNPVTVTVP